MSRLHTKDLVTIISPCYNVAPYIGRLLDSILGQTYQKLEIILVNDGSTDSTGDVIKSYKSRFLDKGFIFKYIEQQNGGQSSAVNNALKHVTGEFLTWPDPDDWMTPDAIEKKVNFLRSHPDVGMVRCNITIIKEKTNERLREFETTSSPYELPAFFDKLLMDKTWFAPIGYMARMEYFDLVNPEREIYVSKPAGQNWQMMLPLTNKYATWQIPDILGYYLWRAQSHSRKQKSLAERLEYLAMSQDVVLQTLARIPNGEKFVEAIKIKYADQQYAMALADKECSRGLLFKLFLQRMSLPLPFKRRCKLCIYTISYVIGKKRNKW